MADSSYCTIAKIILKNILQKKYIAKIFWLSSIIDPYITIDIIYIIVITGLKMYANISYRHRSGIN